MPGPTTGTDPNPFRYGGQFGYYTDTTLNLILCGARWYSPTLGRWLSRDPSGYAGGPNLYEYCMSNPVGLVDATGERPITPDELRTLGFMYKFRGTVPMSIVNGAVGDVKNYILSLPVGKANPINLKALLWAMGQLGNTNYGQNGFHTDPYMRNFISGENKCNVFVADAYIQGGGVPPGDITRWQYFSEKQPYGANFLGDPNNSQDHLGIAAVPVPGYIVAFANPNPKQHGHAALLINNNLLIYAGGSAVKIGLMITNQTGHNPPVYRYYK